MTALNIIQFPGAFHMFGDTAVYDNSARLVEFKPKIYAVPSAKSAIGFAGAMVLCEFVREVSCGARSISELLERAETAAKFAVEKGDLNGHQTILVAGFTNEGDQQLWQMKFRASEIKEPKFVRLPSTRWEFTPKIEMHIANASAMQMIPEFCRFVLDGQRVKSVSIEGWNGGKPAHIVGGDGVLVSVTPDSITEKIVVSWPDIVGAQISTDQRKSLQGVDAGASSNYSIDTSAGKVSPTTSSASMISAATGTNIGNMTGDSGLASIFNGATNSAQTACGTRSATSGYAGKNYSSAPKRIDHVITYGSNDNGYRDMTGSGAPVTLTLYGKNGGAPSTDTDGTTLGTLSFNDALTNAQTIDSSDKITAWDYVWVRVGASGGARVVLAELQFYTPGVADNMTLVTAAQTTDNPVSKASVLFFYDPSGGPILNTDITAEVTCDGGANWSLGTLTLVTAYGQDGHYVVVTEDVDCTPGTSYAGRVTTANNKVVDIYGLCIHVGP